MMGSLFGEKLFRIIIFWSPLREGVDWVDWVNVRDVCSVVDELAKVVQFVKC